MKQFLIILIIAFSIQFIHANGNEHTGSAELSKTISISFNKIQLKEALYKLGEQSEFSFAYNNNLSGMNDIVNEQFSNKSVEYILDSIIEDKPIEYQKVGDKITFSKRKSNRQSSQGMLKSELSGYVYDGETKEALIGATVYIKGTTIGSSSDYDGYYRLPILSPGSYSIVVSFIGYENQTVDIDIKPNETLEKNFHLTYGSSALEEVTITVQAQGQVKAINQQLASGAITNIVSAERIQEVPDANIAESIGRLPGVSIIRSDGEGDQIVVRGLEPKYNLVTVNGVRSPSTNASSNAVGLAGISPYMVEGIEVQKSLTPDKDADVVGAIVNLRLKDAPAGTHGNLIFENNFNTLTRTPFNPKITAQGSRRFFDNKLGIILQGNYEKIDRSSHRMYGDYRLEGENEEGFRDALVNGGNFSHHELTRQRYGATVLLDYKLPNGKITLSSFANGFTDEGWERTRSMNSLESTYHNNNTVYQRKNISFVSSLSYEQKMFLNSTLDVGISYTSARSDLPNQWEMEQTWYGLSDLFEPLRNTSVYALNNISKDLQNQDSSNFINVVGLAEEHFKEQEFTAQINWEVPFVINSNISGTIKTGGKVRLKERKNDRDYTRMVLIDGGNFPIRDAIPGQNPEIDFAGFGDYVAQNVASLNMLDQTYSQSILGGKFQMSDFLQKDLIVQVVDRLKDSDWVGSPFAIDPTLCLPNDYEGKGLFSAGYLMTDLKLWRYVNIVGGVRYENGKTDYSAWGITDWGQHNSDEELLRDSLRQNDFLLPMVNMKIKPLEWMDIRLAYTQSLARPSYFRFMPRYYLTIVKDLENVGNPDMRPARSHNLDAYVSFYSNKLGLLSVGVFYKKIENFDYDRTFYVVNDSINDIHPYDVEAGAGRRIHFPMNNPFEGSVKGIEVDWQTVFWYLPGPLKGLVFNINYARMYSGTNYQTIILNRIQGEQPWEFTVEPVDSSYSRPLLQQPKDVFNASIGWDYKGFSARLAYNFKGKTLTGVGGSDTEKDSYSQNYQQWDLAVRQKLPWAGMQISMNITNLSNSFVQDFKSIGQDLPTREEYYGTMIILGLRFEL